MPWTPNNQTLVPAKVKFNKDFPPALMRGALIPARSSTTICLSI